MRLGKWILTGAASLAMFAASQSAHAATLEFFEGNNCTQDRLGGTNTIEHLRSGGDAYSILSPEIWKFAGITTSNSQPWGDEARSVLITTNWKRQREPRTGKIYIYDDPHGKKSDDWVVIVIRDAEQIPANGLCIGTFERPFDRNGVFLERHPQNGLDGKISYITALCQATCRGNLTTDPNPPPPPRPRLVVKKRDGAQALTPEQARLLKRRPKK